MKTLKFSSLQQLLANHVMLYRLCDNHQHFTHGLLSTDFLSTISGQIEGWLESQGYHCWTGWHNLIRWLSVALPLRSTLLRLNGKPLLSAAAQMVTHNRTQ